MRERCGRDILLMGLPRPEDVAGDRGSGSGLWAIEAQTVSRRMATRLAALARLLALARVGQTLLFADMDMVMVAPPPPALLRFATAHDVVYLHVPSTQPLGLETMFMTLRVSDSTKQLVAAGAAGQSEGGGQTFLRMLDLHRSNGSGGLRVGRYWLCVGRAGAEEGLKRAAALEEALVAAGTLLSDEEVARACGGARPEENSDTLLVQNFLRVPATVAFIANNLVGHEAALAGGAAGGASAAVAAASAMSEAYEQTQPDFEALAAADPDAAVVDGDDEDAEDEEAEG